MSLIFIIGFVILIVAIFFVTAFITEFESQSPMTTKNFTRPNSLKKEQNLDKLLSAFKKQRRLTNNQAQDLLDVSDATVTNYFDELEKQGLIRQVGAVGRHVYYELIISENEDP